jgi:hypothetical protein
MKSMPFNEAVPQWEIDAYQEREKALVDEEAAKKEYGGIKGINDMYVTMGGELFVSVDDSFSDMMLLPSRFRGRSIVVNYDPAGEEKERATSRSPR